MFGGAYTAPTVDDCPEDSIVLSGTACFLYDTWELSGDTWSGPINATDKPQGRKWHRLTYDPNRKQVLLFGGETDIRFGEMQKIIGI